MKQSSIRNMFAPRASVGAGRPSVLTDSAQNVPASVPPIDAKPIQRVKAVESAPWAEPAQATGAQSGTGLQPPAQSRTGPEVEDVQLTRPTDVEATVREGMSPARPVEARPAAPPPAAASEGVEGGAAASPAPAIGQRLRVWWTDDEAWYPGYVKRQQGGKHFVQYDDGDSELLDLSQERYELLPAKAAAVPKPARRLVQKRSTPAAAVDASLADDLEDESEAGASDSDDDDFDAASDGAAAMSADESEDDDGDEDDDGMVNDSGDEAAPAAPKAAAAKRKRAPPAAAAPAKRAKAGAAKPPKPAAGGACTPIAAAGRATADVATPQAVGYGPAGAGRGAASAGRSVEPRSAAKRQSMVDRLSVSTPAAATPSTPLPAGNFAGAFCGDAARFLSRYSTPKFAMLHPDGIRDAQKRAPGDPQYDPSTLYVPRDWAKTHKVSDGQQQWWEFKAQHFDSVLLFKMGKFYEMFEMDAFVGVETLGLSFMKGDQPHAGFPEAAYYTMAETLARAGHRVVIIEQTETPEQLKASNDAAAKGQKRKVVARTKVAVLTQGTLTEPLMLTAAPEATYTAAVVELPRSEGLVGVWIGICAVDAAAASVVLGQFHDDELRSKLRRHLLELRVSEVVLPRGGSLLDPATKVMLKNLLPEARVSLQQARGAAWDGTRVQSCLDKGALFEGATVPPALQACLADAPAHRASLAAFSGMLHYLQDAMLDRAVLCLGTIEPLCTEPEGPAAAPETPADKQAPFEALPGSTMSLDGAALQNLEVVETSEGLRAGSVLAALDRCVTAGGKRLLRQWVTRPLLSVSDIAARQDCVADLLGPAADAMDSALALLRGLGDIERSIARLAATAGGALGRDAPNVVLYEDPSRRRVSQLTGALTDLQAIESAVDVFGGVSGELTASLLQRLVSWGEGVPDFRAQLKDLMGAADWAAAAEEGRVTPAQGVDAAYDAATAGLAAADAALQQHLTNFRALVEGGSEVTFVTVNKDTHVLELPERLAAKVPRSYHQVTTKKGVKRYSCDALEALVATRKEALDALDLAQGHILSGLVVRFAESKSLWLGACAACAQLDALMSLARAAQMPVDGGAMCRPVVTPERPAGAGPGGAFFQAKALRHPTAIHLASAAAFVPNDIELGVDGAAFVLLTGPNMGGKSTLMRQVCVATLMAQVGAWLPADSVVLSPTDAIFVRMGAKDHILMGQSTFFVELSETASMLSRVTRHSLVALDELGRGTATMDGAAIAGAVLDHMLSEVGCRGVLATHYHKLAQEHADDNRLSIKHMACSVTEGDAESLPKVTFLYKVEAGSCPKSYGANVARIAGIPQAVALKAAQISQALEDGAKMPQRSTGPCDAALSKLVPLLADAGKTDVAALRAQAALLADLAHA